jgi:hypothetical protein
MSELSKFILPHKKKSPRPLAKWTSGVIALSAVLALSLSSMVHSPPAAAASVLSESATPATDADRNPVELGVKFTTNAPITVTGIRFYKASANTGTHVGTLWNSAGKALSRVTFTGETTSGWQTATLVTPVAVAAGETLVASYVAPGGRYSSLNGGFTKAVTDGTVTFPAGAGVYNYTTGSFPAQSHGDSNYYVDIVYKAGVAAPAPATAKSVFPNATKPVTVTDADANPVELGVKFTTNAPITVTGIRFYKGPANTGTHVGTLWNSAGTALSRVTFTGETSSGWQTATLAKPVAVAAGETLVASYLAPRGRYSADSGGLSKAVTDGTVTFPAGAGVYNYTTGSFPAQTYGNANYFVDIVYKAGAAAPAPATPPVAAKPPVQPPVAAPAPPATGASVLTLPRERWWGGPGYYSKFSKANAAGWDEPGFFPISVFFGKPEHAGTLAGMGINTYMGAEHDGSSISTITGKGISLLAQPEWTPAELGTDPLAVGWHVSDECEMGLGGCRDGDDEYGRLATQKGFVDGVRANNDGRFVQANFGNGVLGSYWAPNTMDDHLALLDVSSVDKYAYSSTHVQELIPGSPFWPKGKNPASAGTYGWLQDRMETFSAPAASKPNWVFVETAKPFLTEADAGTITGAQIEGAVWNGIIHGAAGIAYFQHNNNGCGTYSLIDCGAALQDTVRSVNADVKSLAPVINSQGYTWSFGPQLETSLKTHNGSAYIFAMTDGSTGSKSFTLPSGLTGNVEVVGEGRTIPVTNGTFSDSFAAESTHHVYRIALG